jgi:hypothetical protein
MVNKADLVNRLAADLAEARSVLGDRQLIHLLFAEADRLRRRADDEAMALQALPDGDRGDDL